MKPPDENGYYYIGRSTGDLNRWFHHCETTGHPYVRVRPKTKFAWVEIDLIGQDYNLTAEAAAAVRELLLTHNVGYAQLYPPSGEYPVCFAGAGRIPKEEAPAVAAKLVAIASDPRNREGVGPNRRQR